MKIKEIIKQKQNSFTNLSSVNKINTKSFTKTNQNHHTTTATHKDHQITQIFQRTQNIQAHKAENISYIDNLYIVSQYSTPQGPVVTRNAQ